MKIKFLGTGAAEGVPAMFCNCEICRRVRALGRSEFRTRSQVLIDDIVSVDFPPEAYSHSLEYGVNLSALKYLFVTHSHMDHFYAHDFILRGYKYAELEENILSVFGNKEVKNVFDECTAREMKPSVASHIVFNVIKPYTVINAEEYKIISLPARHQSEEDCLLYYIERNGKGYLHFYDTNRVDARALTFLAENRARVDVVAFDCTFAEVSADENARHMGVKNAIMMKEKMTELGILREDAKNIITHFSHNGNPLRARLKEIEKEYGVIAAYDGMEIIV